MSAPGVTIANARWMRLVALLLAILLALAGWFAWQNAQDRNAAAPLSADRLQELGTPAEVSDCVDRREAEINSLLDEGLLDADSAELSLQRARSLCVQRN